MMTDWADPQPGLEGKVLQELKLTCVMDRQLLRQGANNSPGTP